LTFSWFLSYPVFKDRSVELANSSFIIPTISPIVKPFFVLFLHFLYFLVFVHKS